MALAAAALESDLLSIFTDYPASRIVAGVEWADAIDTYSKTGTANAVPPTVLAAVTVAFEVALGDVFDEMDDDPEQIATDLVAATTAYWVLVTFAGATGPPNPTAGVAALIASLTTIFANLGGTAASKADEIATALDTFTKAVVVTFPLPVGPVNVL